MEERKTQIQKEKEMTGKYNHRDEKHRNENEKKLITKREVYSENDENTLTGEKI
jgi:hypothetical protein